MKKTIQRFDWATGHTVARRLSRSFKTLAEAETFAAGKQSTEIYKSKGLYKVEWVKIERRAHEDS